MKKLSIILTIVLLISLCSCRKLNQSDNNYDASINSNSSISNASSIITDFTLPERDDPTNTTTSTDDDSYKHNITTRYDENDVSSQLTITKNLSIETQNSYYRTSSNIINIVLYSGSGIFNYYTDFFLQKYENGKWTYYPTINGEINYEYNISSSSNKTLFINYDLNKLYKTPLLTGEYRFIQESDDCTIVSNSFQIVDDIYYEEHIQ